MRSVEIPLDDPNFAARFRSYVDADTQEWFGCCDRDGYGIFTTTGPTGERVKFRAHRIAWAIANQRQPSGVIRHQCDTPPCCNPHCLLDGTQRQNIADRDDPARRSRRHRRKMIQVGQSELPLGSLC
jgi:HNH endonuclease